MMREWGSVFSYPGAALMDLFTPLGRNSCVILQSPLIDGSPCGYGGHCQNATCHAGSVSETIDAWYKQNLQYAIREFCSC